MFALLVVFASCGGDDGDDKTIYTVTFETDGGTPVPSAQKVEEGNTVTAPSTNPTKAGYVFLYWHLSGSATAYNFHTPINGNITLHAKWQEEATVEYWQVTWELNGGTWPTDDNHAMQVVKGGTLAEPNAPTILDSTFDGWYKEASFANKITFPYDVSSVTTDFKLYAKWGTVTEKAPHETDLDLQLTGYYLAYTIQVINEYKKGLKPSYIEDGEGQTILRANYNLNGTLNYLNFYRYNYNVIFSYDRPMLLFRAGEANIENGHNALSALNNGTYDYDKDPGIIMSYFGSFSGTSVFTSLANLRTLANNNGITEEVYKKIALPDGSYKLLVYVRKNEKTYGKYVGYSTTEGKSFTYWCIDPDDSSFGRAFTMKIPFDF